VAVVKPQTLQEAIVIVLFNHSGVEGVFVDASRVGVVMQGAREDNVACLVEGKHGVSIWVVTFSRKRLDVSWRMKTAVGKPTKTDL